MNEDQDAAAKALYERNTNGSAPRWEQLGEITKTVWREELDRRATADGVPAAEPLAVRSYAYGGSTGINDYLMTDGTVKAMRPEEVKWAASGVTAPHNDQGKTR